MSQRVPTPPPADAPTPSGTRRPNNTLADYEEAKQQLAESQQTVTPEAVEAKTQTNRLGRLEERADRADGRLTVIESKLDHNSGATVKSLSWAQVTAGLTAASTALLFVSQVLGQWGADHPEAKFGIVGLLVGIAQAVNKARAASAARPVAATSAPPTTTPPEGS